MDHIHPLTTFASYEATHCLIERKTGKQINEIMPVTEAIKFYLLYNSWFGRLLMQLPPTWWLLGLEHKLIARDAESPGSKRKIPKFIKAYAVDPSEAAKPVEEYATLQEFFTRELKPGARPIAEPDNPRLAVQPADSRLVVYNDVAEAHRLWIKGRHFSVGKLLGPEYEEKEWEHCAIAINRLAPIDCHRLHAAVPGRVVKMSKRGNRFMTSEWVSVHSVLDVLTENERLIMEFDTQEFGPVVQVMIGASAVGSVKPLVRVGDVLKKGEEVAVFAFGGSIMTTLFKAGRIGFDQDLVERTRKCCETRVNIGDSLGRAL